MRDYIGLFFVLCLVGGGTALLYEGIVDTGRMQGAIILFGATLVALGAFVLAPVIRGWRDWFEFRKRIRRFESETQVGPTI
jgi:hypothetical protein